MALPLFVVTMASQNLPGVAAQRAAGYATPVSPVITTTGVATLLLAPFGGYALNLAAITAAICMGREAHEDPARRYMAAVMAGVFYVVLGLVGGAVVGLIAAFPKALVLAVAGFALLGTIGGSLAVATAGRAQPRAGADHLPGDRLGAGAGRRRRGLLGRGRRRLALAVQHWRAPAEAP